MKTCPILKAGTMMTSYEKSFSVGPGMGSTRNNAFQHESAECIGLKCEWFGQGCPAHPAYTEPGGKTPHAWNELLMWNK